MKTIPYKKFRHGQRVAYDFYGTKVSDGKIIKKNGMVYLYPLDIMLCTINTDYWEETSTIKNIKLLDRTLDDLEEGDVLVDIRGNERKILGKCGEVCFLSYVSEKDTYSYTTTILEIKSSYTLKQEEEKLEFRESTEEEKKILDNPILKIPADEQTIIYKGKTYVYEKP